MTTDFTPGSRLGDYVLDAYVGAGSFGVVWRGHAEPGGETVAIKLLTGALSSGDAASMRGDVEVLAATAASRSPHVVRVLGGGSQPVPYIVMEYVQGTDLAAMLQTETRLTPTRTIDVGLAIADALQVLNQARIVHRDIKPANVLVDSTGVIKLTDFGVAKIVGYETITMTGQVAMTMAYAAPEVWEDDDDGDLRFGRPSHRSDLYALGILLYQCLCGVTPFRGNYGVLYRAHRERPPDLSTLPLETPASLREAIRRCLEKRQQDRPVDAAETYLMLQRASIELAEAEGTAPKDEPLRFGQWLRVSPHPTLPWAWRCRHETSGVEATVEVYFADDIDIGEELRRVTKANSKLATLGAEKIIESNRLLMRPQESWTSAPPGEFQFWVAREDRHPEAARSVSGRTLQRGVLALDALIEAAARERIGLSLRDNLTLTAAGEIYVTRVGLAPGSEYLLEQAMTVLRALALEPDARAFIAPVSDFADLVARATTALESDDAISTTPEATAPDSTELLCRSCHQPLKPGELICGNCGHYQVRDAATVMVDGSQSAATRLSQPAELASAPKATGIVVAEISVEDRETRLKEPADLKSRRFAARRPILVMSVAGVIGVTLLIVLAGFLLNRSKGVASGSIETGSKGASESKKPITPTTPVVSEETSFAAPIPEPNRADCAAINGTSYQSPTEEGWFRINCGSGAGSTGLQVSSGVALPNVQAYVGCWAGTNATLKATSVSAIEVSAIYQFRTQTPVNRTYKSQPDGSIRSPDGVFAWSYSEGIVSGSHTSPTGTLINDVLVPCGSPAPLSNVTGPQTNVPSAAPAIKASLASLKGQLIYQAVMDGTSKSFSPPRYAGSCTADPVDQAGSELKFGTGLLDFAILKKHGQTNINLNTPARETYVLEVELAFAPGSNISFYGRLRTTTSQNVYFSLSPTIGRARLYSANPATTGSTELGSAALAGMNTGQRLAIALAVGPNSYSVFSDGVLLTDYQGSDFQGTQKLYLGVNSCGESPPVGAVHLYAARVYELAGQ